MPEAAVEPAQPGQPQQQRGGLGQIVSTIVRMAFFWYVMNWMKGNKGPTASGGAGSPGMALPKYDKSTPVDMYVYLSEAPYLRSYNPNDLVWEEHGLSLAAEADTKLKTITYKPSKNVQNNGSIYIHAVFALANAPIDKSDPEYDENAVFGRVHMLNSYLPRPKNKTGVNLLKSNASEIASAAEAAAKLQDAPREIINFLKPNISIALVDHFNAYPKNGIPPMVRDHLVFDDNGRYYPVVYFNDFWLLRDKLVPVNDTLEELEVHLHLSTLSAWWWQIQMQLEQSFKMQLNTGLSQEGESDELKRVLLEGNPVLLAVTFAVSLLHTVFDFLAFKNDIGFWKNNKSMEGLSARSVLINAFCQLVILLYLFDNETSYVVLISSAVGTAIEFWKVTKAMDVSILPNFPFIKLGDKASYSNKETKQHDADATRYLSYVLYPLVFGYSIYALYYETHKSWYSWILSSLVGAVYMFGFILMCPQLYLNYKLKSVAHLPWRQYTYKFLNTIIDDLFAFVIKMPTLHRLSVFRDDIVFLVFLYQRWIYRVDKTRVNEFGYSAEDAAAEAAQELTNGATDATSSETSKPDSVPQLLPTLDEPAEATKKRKGGNKGKEPAPGAAPLPTKAAEAVEQKKDK